MRTYGFLLVLASLAAACSPTSRDVSIRFDGLVGDSIAVCGGTYPDIGTTGTTLTLADFRLYVSDVRLVTSDGREVPVMLDQGDWQTDDVALLDFEDGTADCEAGNALVNGTVSGQIPDDGSIYTGVRFQLGVPEALNHLDVSTAEGPLSFTSMYWGWNGGYKFLRVEGRSTGMPDGFRVHIGSTGCTGDGRGNIDGCIQDNRASVELTGFDPDADRIAVDLAALFSDSDLDHDQGDSAGCQGTFGDPDCEPIFHALGLPFDGAPPSGPQKLFRVVQGD